MTADRTTGHPLPYRTPDEGDVEMARLLESWRYSGSRAGWEAIVGHGPQIERLR